MSAWHRDQCEFVRRHLLAEHVKHSVREEIVNKVLDGSPVG